MSQSEVFRPTGGDLLARPGPVDEGYMAPMDSFRKRPATQGSLASGYRFGQLSQNSFFTRHNPHPNRVRHIKGLLDVPICAVNDNGYFASPKYSLNFPPNAFNSKQLNKWQGRVPVNAINVNSQLHPINTVTGLQYFTGLNSYPFRERAIPRVGLVPVTETWRDELQALTRAIGISEEDLKKKEQPSMVPERPRTQYSETTGRLIPPPSRAMSRGQSRQASRQGQRGYFSNLQHISGEPDIESMVMSMLCQILQTEDINAVQAWLCSAGDREKGVVMDLIKAAMSGQEDYYKRDVDAEFVDDSKRTILPPINEAKPGSLAAENNAMAKTFDRLVVDEPGVPGEPTLTAMKKAEEAVPEPKQTVPDTLDDVYKVRPPVSDAFRRQSSRPATQASGGRGPVKPPQADPIMNSNTFRYTKSAEGKRQKNTQMNNSNEVQENPNTF